MRQPLPVVSASTRERQREERGCGEMRVKPLTRVTIEGDQCLVFSLT